MLKIEGGIVELEESYKVILGRILWVNNTTGYGCVIRDDGEGDFLFQIQAMNSVSPLLREDENIGFEIAKDDPTMKVVNIYRVIK